MSILYAISIVYIAGEYDGPGFCTPIGICILPGSAVSILSKPITYTKIIIVLYTYSESSACICATTLAQCIQRLVRYSLTAARRPSRLELRTAYVISRIICAVASVSSANSERTMAPSTNFIDDAQGCGSGSLFCKQYTSIDDSPP